MRSSLPRGRRSVAVVAALALVLVAAAVATAGLATSQHAGPQGDGTSYTPVGWHVTPVGKQVELGERPYGVALSPNGRWLLVSNDGVADQSVMLVDTTSGAVAQTIHYPAPKAVFLGVAWSPDSRHAYVSAGANDQVRVYEVAGGQLSEAAPIQLQASDTPGSIRHPFPAGLAVSSDGKTLYVADNLANAVSVVDLASGTESIVQLSSETCPIAAEGFDPSRGTACELPYTVTLSHDGGTAYVSHWGKNLVSAIDTATKRVVKHIRVGTHPSAMTLSADGAELFVANTDSDSISVVRTDSNRVGRSFSLRPYPEAPVGSNPNALAASPDGRTLYVANAGNNDIDVVRLARGGGRDRVAGMIPTGWYPTGVAVAPDGGQLLVANAKGLGAGPNPEGPNPEKDPESEPDQYVGSMIKGTLSSIATPTASQLARWTEQVVDNNGFDEHGRVRMAGATRQHVVPRWIGQPSPIKHIIYIVNENRTYDQVLGDLGKGNGDPSLTLFGDESAPNHRELARRYVTLDNLYAAGEVSNDGWEWSTAANANTLDQKTWPTNYGGRGYIYTGEGGTLAAAPGRNPENSYIWDRLSRHRISYRNYGFWATGTPPVKVYNEPNLDAHTDHAYPGYNLAIRDQVRFAEWLREFRGYQRSGKLPTVQFVKFPNDHTCGTSPDCPTPKAMVADSDWATGKLVDAVSHSRFWKSTAIFVIEDDAQDGPDHVDAHRTLAHVISPYTQTGRVDSTFYSTVSLLRTMELILGLQPMTQFDAAANPMFASFTDHPDVSAYQAIKPDQPLDEMNPATAPMAAESSRMDVSREDQAPEQELNKAIWKSVRGAESHMPAPVFRNRQSQQATDSDDG